MREGLSEKNSLTSSNPPNRSSICRASTPACTPQHPSFAPFTLVLISSADPGVFATLARTLGAQDLQVVELYDIEPVGVRKPSPYLWLGPLSLVEEG